MLSSLKPPLSFPSVSGAICTFNSQYAGLPLKAHEVGITAVQSGSGTPSPTNPRPITGYSAINISHSDADTSSPTVYTIQIGSTVYGGTYDAITGILTVTHIMWDLGDLSYTPNSTYPNIYNAGFAVAYRMKNTTNGICSCYEIHTSSDVANYDYGFAIGNGLNTIYFKNKDINTAADFKTQMQGQQIVYELETPTTIQLSPAQILTLLGENNIWADTGDTTLQYIKLG